MRLHRFLAALVIALSFNVAASKDARALGACYAFLSSYDSNDETMKAVYKVGFKGFFLGLRVGRIHENKISRKEFKESSIYEMKTDEIYYNALKYCRKEPSENLDIVLYRFFLETEMKK